MREVEEARKFQDIVEETFKVSGSTNLADFFPALRLGERRLVRLHKKRDAYFQSLVDEHKRNGNANDDHNAQEGGEGINGEKKSIIDVLLSLQRSDPEYYTDDIVKGAAGVRILHTYIIHASFLKRLGLILDCL